LHESPCGKPQGTVAGEKAAIISLHTEQEESGGETAGSEIKNKKINGNEKGLSFVVYGNTGLPHGFWVRRFSGL
jgi:hypothetical protein